MWVRASFPSGVSPALDAFYAALVHGHLDRMGVRQHFSAVVTSVEHGTRKPGPAIFAHTLELVRGSQQGSIYVGDSYAADYLGAAAAGIDCLLLDPDERHHIPARDRLRDIASVRQAWFLAAH